MATLCAIVITNIAAPFAGSRAQVNEVTDLFDKNIESKNGLEQSLSESVGVAVEGSKSGSVASELHDKEKEYTNLNHNDLETASYGSKEYEEFERGSSEGGKFLIDYNDAGVMHHKKEVDEIAKKSNDLMAKLTESLKQHGIDCRELANNRQIDKQWLIEQENKTEKEVVYDKHFCEYLRNRYRCKDVLTTRCSDPAYVAGTLTNVTGNMVHSITHDGTLSIGVNQEKYFYNNWGSQHDFTFIFDVSNRLGIHSFQLLNIDWADHVLIKLNDNIIFQGPNVNGKIEMSTAPANYRRGPDGARYFGVDVGLGDFVPANTKQYYSRYSGGEFKHYLKDGRNVLNIRLVYAGGGKIWTVFKYTAKICRNWQETWDEQCVQE